MHVQGLSVYQGCGVCDVERDGADIDEVRNDDADIGGNVVNERAKPVFDEMEMLIPAQTTAQ